MYVQDHFALDSRRAIELISNSAGDLITCGAHGIQATHLPFSFNPHIGELGVLRTHLSKVNQQWRDEGECLVIFHGPEHYISPSIVASSSDSSKVVPTWNYVTVHVRGKMSAHHDEESILASLRELVAGHEEEWSLNDVSDEYLARMMPAMVALEIQVIAIEAKAKMSQNASSADVEGIIAALQDFEGGAQTADFMREVSLPHAYAREALVDSVRVAHLKSNAQEAFEQ